MKKYNGFTLIELLIVVAIIAILAAIAIPNFLAAQVRAKVARTKGEMRTLATGLEAYYTDYSLYPMFVIPDFNVVSQCSRRFIPITTPIAYLTSVPKPDPFGNPQYDPTNYDTYDYVDEYSFSELRRKQSVDPRIQWGGATWGRAWRISGSGPDRYEDYAYNIFNTDWPSDGMPDYYDPTNGTISNGDIIRFGGTGNLNYEGHIIGEIVDN